MGSRASALTLSLLMLFGTLVAPALADGGQPEIGERDHPPEEGNASFSVTIDGLFDAWEAKRGISAGVSGADLDALHTRIMSMGATGAKLLGAGGGGFFLVHGEAGLRARLAELGPEHRIIPLGIDHVGSTIIHED